MKTSPSPVGNRTISIRIPGELLHVPRYLQHTLEVLDRRAVLPLQPGRGCQATIGPAFLDLRGQGETRGINRPRGIC